MTYKIQLIESFYLHNKLTNLLEFKKKCYVCKVTKYELKSNWIFFFLLYTGVVNHGKNTEMQH